MAGLRDLRPAFLLAAGFVLGCHAAPAAQSPAGVRDSVVHDTAAGMQVTTLVRPTPGVVQLSLFVDAGSRDAEPPQLATVAALVAAQADPALRPEVFPDGTEIALRCSSSALARCLAALGRALATRDPSDEAIQRARLALVDARRRAQGHDPERGADRLALQALLGSAAEGFFPLGRADTDDRVTTEAVRAFLTAHYGPRRALLVVAGEVEPQQLRRAASEAFEDAPAATRARAERALTPAARPSFELGIDDRDALSVALLARDEAGAEALTAALREALVRPTARAGYRVRGHVFAVRGGALGLLRIAGPKLEPRLARTTAELARLLVETPAELSLELPQDDLHTLTRRMGHGFASRGATRGEGVSFGVGVLAAGGRADRKVRGNDPDATERTRRMASLRDLFARALTSARPVLHGEITEHAASVVLDNGARIDVRATLSERVAIAIRSLHGAEQDTPLLHGRAALLATLTTTACDGMGPELLQRELSRLQATLSPRVDPESYGLVLVVPAANYRQGLDLALRCMRAPSLHPPHVATAALRVQTRLGGPSAELGLRAEAAALIAPRAPGLVAPWGSPGRLGNVDPRALAETLPAALSGARWAVAVVGPVPPRDAVERCARRLYDLPAGHLPRPALPGEPSSELHSTAPKSPGSQGVSLLAVYAVRDPQKSEIAARVFASALRASLARVPGLEPLWHGAGAGPYGAFASVLVRVPQRLAPAIDRLLTDLPSQQHGPALEAALDLALEAGVRRHSAAGSRVDVRADRIARTRLGAPEPESSRADALALLAAFMHAKPVWRTLQ